MSVVYEDYKICASWGRRAETPAAIATRFLRMIDGMSISTPLFKQWIWVDQREFEETDGDGGKYPLGQILPKLVQSIEANVWIIEGYPSPEDGYYVLVGTRPPQEKEWVTVGVNAGNGSSWVTNLKAFHNSATFSVEPQPDPSLVTYDVLRSVLLILAEIWEVTWAHTSPPDITPFWSNRTFRCAWMSYISPHFAPQVTPPASAIVEYRPNGGLFMAATTAVHHLQPTAPRLGARDRGGAEAAGRAGVSHRCAVSLSRCAPIESILYLSKLPGWSVQGSSLRAGGEATQGRCTVFTSRPTAPGLLRFARNDGQRSDAP